MSMSPSSSGHVNMMKGQPFHVKYREIIRRMSFLIGALLVFRLGAHIPVPGINNAALENCINYCAVNVYSDSFSRSLEKGRGAR